MASLAVYLKEGLAFPRDLSLDNSADSYLCFRLINHLRLCAWFLILFCVT